jgi:hypothetical protein
MQELAMVRGTVRKFRGPLARLGGLGVALGATLCVAACGGSGERSESGDPSGAPGTVAGTPGPVGAVVAEGPDGTAGTDGTDSTAATDAPAPAEPPVFDPAATPCPVEAAVCVDIDGRQSWLQQDGAVTFGPVPISSGRPGEDTPRGTFQALRKVKDEVSYIFAGDAMPNSVYFTTNGHALHGGDVNVESHGCVHLPEDAAAHYFDTLGIGATVVVY